VTRVSHSRMQVLQTCEQLHQYQYVQGYRPTEGIYALEFGSDLVHKPLEAWKLAHKDGRPADALPAALAAIDGCDADELDKIKARVLLCGYDARWAGAMVDYEVLAVEVPFEIKIGDVTYVGFIDSIWRQRSTSRNLVVEHKSVSQKTDISAASDYWRRLRMEPQISMYFRGARALGFEPNACLWDVLVRPDIKLLQATPEASRKYKKTGELYANQRAEDETLPEFQARLTDLICETPTDWYARREVVRLPEELTRFEDDVAALSKRCKEAEEDPFYHAPRNASACFKWGGRPCSFLPVCDGSGSLDDESKFVKKERT
jgi:hypothetical protein